MSKRHFSHSERIALFIAADGKCERCGQPLGESWHADHITPYSKGGSTTLINGQALCPDCNLKKGDRMTIEFRSFQEEFINVALRKARQGEKHLIADVHPGSGKTLAACAAADRLMYEGYIEQVVVLVPRLNLAAQFELDWKVVRGQLPWLPTMRNINHCNNDTHLLLANADGYITTYSSLVSNPVLHLRQIAAKRTLIIFDEADRLGADYIHNDFTHSAKWAEKIAEQAVMTFVMSGTPMRADNKPLLFARYTSPDASGDCKLIPDVSSTYRDGVREGYLRRFEFRLVDGGYELRKLDSSQHLTIQETEYAIGQVLEHKDIYEPLIDRFVKCLEEQKRKVDPCICGLIAANRQAHARDIEKYINRRYPSLKTLIAVSDDGSEAHQNLRKFKRGKHDVLITVSMAYVGYDHKPISVLLLLTSFRAEGYLRQLVARGLRMMADVPQDRQYCLAIVPDDKRMAEFVNALRDESEWAYKQRLESLQYDGTRNSGDYQQNLSYVASAVITEMRAMGLDPSGDLSPEKLPIVQNILDQVGLSIAAPDAWSLFQALSLVNFAEETPADNIPQRATKTLQEQMSEARSYLRKLAAKCDYLLNEQHGETYKHLYRVYTVGVPDVKSLEEIEQRIQTVQRWMNQEHYDGRR